MGFRFNPRPFRWLALAGMIAVLGATLSSFLTKSRERPQPRPAPEPIAPQVNQQTQAFSLSKTSGDHTLYTVQANEVTHFKDKVVLHGVSILLYGKEGNRHDIIETQECEFNPTAQSLRIPGEVIMNLGIPPAKASSTQEKTAPGGEPDSVSIVTMGLIFDQASGVTSTDQEVRFRFAQGQGTAQGARYDPTSQQLTLRSAVRLGLSEPAGGNAGAEALDSHGGTEETADTDSVTNVRAGSLRFQRGDSVVYLSGPVELTRGPRTLQAGDSEIVLDASRRARSIRLEGGVEGVDQSDGQLLEVHAQRGLLELSEQGRLSSLHLEDEVEWSASAAPSTPSGQNGPLRQGHAQNVQLLFTQPGGLLERIVADRDVRMMLREAPQPPAQAARPAPSGKPSFGAGTQTLAADRVEMTMAPGGKVLQGILARPHATLDLVPFSPQEQPWRITGQEFRMQFDAAGNLTRFAAEQAVRVTAEAQEGPSGRKTSTSEHLSATLDPRTRSVSRIEQWGDYQYQDAAKQASAERAVYSADDDEVTLRGEGSVWDRTGKLSASRITLSNSNGRIQAEGSIATTFFSATSSGTEPAIPVHAVADRLSYDSVAGKARYEGRVRLWQGENLLQAERVDLDRRQRQMEAWGNVYSAFPGQASAPADPASSRPSKQEPLEIRSDRMLYKEAERRAVYQGKTRLRNQTSTVDSERLEVFLAPSTESTSNTGRPQIDHAVATGNVVIVDLVGDTGRKATAERAEYFPVQSLFHLFGKPATVWDPRRGSTQGVRLTYRVADDRIFVEGEPGLPAETRRQVQR